MQFVDKVASECRINVIKGRRRKFALSYNSAPVNPMQKIIIVITLIREPPVVVEDVWSLPSALATSNRTDWIPGTLLNGGWRCISVGGEGRACSW